MNRLNLKGKKFGRLTVIYPLYIETGVSWWLCKCSCNNINTHIIRGTLLVNGITKSCGCLQIEKSTKHGMTGTRFYHIWVGVKSRSYYNKDFKNYSERGISICHSWLNFKSFKKDMYKTYLSHLKKYGTINTTIERIDNNKGYSKSNCKWATRSQQARNQRSNKYLIYKGKKMILEDWAKFFGLNQSTLHNRLFKFDWPLEKALTTPSMGNWKSKV